MATSGSVRVQGWSSTTAFGSCRGYRPGETQPFSAAVYSLLSASDGTLWIGTVDAACSAGRTTSSKSTSRGRINAIIEDRQHRIWVARSRPPDTNGGLCQAAGEKPRCIGGDDRLRLPYAVTVSEDVARQPVGRHVGPVAAMARRLASELLSRATGAVRGAQCGGERHRRRRRFGVGGHSARRLRCIPHRQRRSRTSEPSRAPTRRRVSALFVDRDQSVWMGTSNDGIYRVSGARVDRFRSESGLSSNAVTSLFRGPRRQSVGGDLERAGPLPRFARRHIFNRGRTGCRSRRFGVGRRRRPGLDRQQGESRRRRWQSGDVDSTARTERHVSLAGPCEAAMGRPGQRARCLSGGPVPRRSRTWMAAHSSASRSRSPRIAIATSGSASSAHKRKLLRIRDLAVQEEFPTNRIPFARVLAADPGGGIWLGLLNGQLGHYRDGKLETFPLPAGRRAGVGSDG